jgi:hypothetical protein
MGAGLLLAPAQIEGFRAIECAPFPRELQRQSSSEFRLAASADQGVRLKVDFLDPEGEIMMTRQVQLSAGATTAFSMPTRLVGASIQVITSGPVQVEAALAYDGSVGAAERLAVLCKPIHASGPRPGGP